MQPYQEASQAVRKQGELPLDIAKGIGKAGLNAATAYAGGAGLGMGLNKVLPFLSKYIPEELAIKGLSKIDPRFGKFIEKAMGAGKTFDEVKDFVGSKIEESQKPPQKKNLIQQVDPELHEYLDNYIKKGIPVLKAGKQALSHPRFKQAIDKLTKAHKTSWDNILQAIYGTQEAPKSNNVSPQPQTPVQNTQQQTPTQPQQSQQGQGGLDPAVMKILQQGQELLQKFKGPQQ